MNKDSRDCETITKYLTFLSLDYYRERRKRVKLKKKTLDEVMAENFANVAREINLEIKQVE